MSDSLAALAPFHLGSLHPVEQLLVVLVAFGPFLVLALVVHLRGRRGPAETEGDQRAGRRPPPQGSDPRG